MFEVHILGRKVKEYPFRLQAIIYLMFKGLCYRGRFGCWIDSRAEIREVQNENER